jgi:hypothetical protein
MINVSTFTIVDCPPREVFDFLTNVKLYPVWQIGVMTAAATEDDDRLGVGARFRVTRKAADGSLTNMREVVAYEPDVTFGHRSIEGDTHGETTYSLEAIGGRTKVTLQLRTDADRIMGMAAPLASRLAKREQKAALGNLKDLLENPKLWRSKR